MLQSALYSKIHFITKQKMENQFTEALKQFKESVPFYALTL